MAQKLVVPLNMRLSDYLRPEYIEIGIVAKSKDELIDKMIEIAARNPKVRHIGKIREAIFEREHIMSTGIGMGCAVPHGKSDAIDDIIIALGITAQPIEYQALDNNPVQIVLLMIRRESDTKLRLALLSHASKILHLSSARASLLQAKTPNEVMEIIRKEEEKFNRD